MTDQILYRVARMYYDDGLSKTEISKLINTSVTHVARLLEEARSQMIVSVVYSTRRVYELEEDLRQRFHLRDAVVVDKCSPGLQSLGTAAADLFERLVRRRPGMLVGLGGGNTLYEMVEALPKRDRDICIVPTSIVGRGPYTQQIDPAVLSTLLWAKSGRQPKKGYSVSVPVYRASLPIMEQKEALLVYPEVQNVLEVMRTAIVVFVGVGAVGEEMGGSSTAVELLSRYGITRGWLREQGVVGEMSNSFFDQDGHSRKEWEYFLGLKADDFRRITEDRDRHVILVAGYKKTGAIRAALRGGLCSALITDQATAEELTVEPERSAHQFRSASAG